MKYAVGYLSFLVLCILLCVYYTADSVTCISSGAGCSQVNGYYTAENGQYLKRGSALSAFPDMFSFFHQRYNTPSFASIYFVQGTWILATGTKQADVHYYHQCQYNPKIPSACVHAPPSSGWQVPSIASNGSSLPPPIIHAQKGKLEDSFVSSSNSQSNIGQLLSRPVTTLILIVIFAVAYYLYAYNVNVASISFSYERVVHQGEYWRMFTASLSHMELFHLAFNTMTLYQLGMVEDMYGSLAYAYLSFSLIFLTMLICVGIDYVLIYKYNRAEQLHAQGIGYSCVLFAWMVALCVRLPKFCPIFLFPTLCVNTWTIPYPRVLQDLTGMEGLPVNLGPFLLLVFTKLIIPNSSFLGHLSGILIGYLLAWHLLDFLTPPLTCCVLFLLWLMSSGKWFWRLAGYDQSFFTLSSFVPPTSLRNFYVFIFLTSLLCLYQVLVLGWVSWWDQLLIRITAIFCLIQAVFARTIEYFAINLAAQQDASLLVLITWGLILVLCTYDILTLIVYVRGEDMLQGNGLNAESNQHIQWIYVLGIVLQVLYLFLGWCILQTLAPLEDTLLNFRLDAASVYSDLVQPIYDRCCKRPLVAFSGRSNRLTSTSESGSAISREASAPPLDVEATSTSTSVEAGDTGISLFSRIIGSVSSTANHGSSSIGYDQLPQESDHSDSVGASLGSSARNPLHSHVNAAAHQQSKRPEQV